MISEEEEIEEKPIVEYSFLPSNYFNNSDEEEEDKVQKIINEYTLKNKFPKIFGEDIPELNDEIKKKNI